MRATTIDAMGWKEAEIKAFTVELGLAAEFAEPSSLAPGEIDQVRGQLAEWAGRYQDLVVVIPDATRPLPDGMLSACLESLGSKRLQIIVGVGLHRAPSDDERLRIPQLREATESGLDVVWTGGLGVERDDESAGNPAVYHPALEAADAIVVLGKVELHQYAGFSGGIKGIAVGCAGAETISTIHRPCLLRSPKVLVGNGHDNPFRTQLVELTAHLPPVFEVQVGSVDDQLRLFWGPTPSGWTDAVAEIEPFWDAPLADAAVVNVAGEKGRNLYQASRGVTQLLLQERCPVLPGGPVVLITDGVDGMGEGAGEQSCRDHLAKGAQWLLDSLATFSESDRCGGGAQRAFIVAKATARNPVYYISRTPCEALDTIGWTYLADRAAFHALMAKRKWLAVPNPLQKLPRTKLAEG